ncbi:MULTISPECIES: carbohydrate ABC transporter permease [Phycicoccus]|uniref:carbohydrate ABC transporter permease n=1 Tax=Phycicoccus TaxID=367298 RepID=UPI00068F2360|nr:MULTISPECIES: sugar ABC transporter permease [Phycicoccus]GIL34268.1 sugar ABC transporter permease [Phycicoccus sp. DTK01]
MSTADTVAERGTTAGTGSGRAPRRRRRGDGQRQSTAGWLFVTPTLVVLGLFLVIPILMAIWVSFTDWTGRGSPFSSRVGFVGTENYQALLTEQGLSRQDFMISLRNTFYYVVGVVPLQTVLALGLAVIVNQRFLKGRTFFRTAFYFPSVVSSVAISLVFLFLFTGTGAVNQFLGIFGIDGPTWFSDPRGLIHLAGQGLGLWSIDAPPGALADHQVMSLSLWDWFSGPSVALSAIMLQVVWTTAGTFMLMFLAALQDLPTEVEEAALVDGANRWQRFRAVTVPHLRPTILLVVTLGVIGTWQVFDQMYVMTQGGPAKTTLTPAYLSYTAAFGQQQWGQGAAMAFLLFVLIFVLTTFQRFVLRDKDEAAAKKARRAQQRAAKKKEATA